jgi:hypothetical protein
MVFFAATAMVPQLGTATPNVAATGFPHVSRWVRAVLLGHRNSLKLADDMAITCAISCSAVYSCDLKAVVEVSSIRGQKLMRPHVGRSVAGSSWHLLAYAMVPDPPDPQLEVCFAVMKTPISAFCKPVPPTSGTATALETG